uniref:8.9 kDa protein n=1 Tax=Ixodes ricinus TaxID=34613 RepID=V5HE29_IXORI
MNILIVCIVIANVVISQGNVEEAGKTNFEIQEQSLLVFDRQECRYLGYRMRNGEVKTLPDPCVDLTCLANQTLAASSGVLSPCPMELLFGVPGFKLHAGGLPTL